MKRTLFPLTTCVLVLASLSLSAFAATEIDGIFYNLNSYGGAEVTSGARAYSGRVNIPRTVVSGGRSYTVTSIGDDAFAGCGSLYEVTVPNSVTAIGDRAFARCTYMARITLPESVTAIGDEAFSGCTALGKIVIPRYVRSIGRYAFNECYNLTEATIPACVTSMGTAPFLNCSNLKKMAILSTTPPMYGMTASFGVNVGSCTLCVPRGSKDAYAATQGWREFKNIEEL